LPSTTSSAPSPFRSPNAKLRISTPLLGNSIGAVKPPARLFRYTWPGIEMLPSIRSSALSPLSVLLHKVSAPIVAAENG
jgi:hypothetical protein